MENFIFYAMFLSNTKAYSEPFQASNMQGFENKKLHPRCLTLLRATIQPLVFLLRLQKLVRDNFVLN